MTDSPSWAAIARELGSFARFVRWLDPGRRRFVAHQLTLALVHDLSLIYTASSARVETWQNKIGARLTIRERTVIQWRRDFDEVEQ